MAPELKKQLKKEKVFDNMNLMSEQTLEEQLAEKKDSLKRMKAKLKTDPDNRMLKRHIESKERKISNLEAKIKAEKKALAPKKKKASRRPGSSIKTAVNYVAYWKDTNGNYKTKGFSERPDTQDIVSKLYKRDGNFYNVGYMTKAEWDRSKKSMI